MFFNEDKNFAMFNDQPLDTYHEIIVSFDYARFNPKRVPTGGFAVVFFRSSFDKPRGGGPESALGYLPSSKTEYCKLEGYKGLNGAVLGVGFDLLGEFAQSTPFFNGSKFLTPNSCSIRQGLEDNFNYIATSKNLINTPKRFKLAEKITNTDDIVYNSVKIVITNGFTNIKVYIKKAIEKDFFLVLEANIPIKDRDAVKAAITSTTLDNDTEFFIKNFNVAGFPGIPRKDRFGECLQNINLGKFSEGNKLVNGNDFVAVPAGGDINVYKLENSTFVLNQVLSESEPMLLLGGNNKFLFGGIKNTTSVIVYYNNDNRFFRSQEINLFDEVDDLEENQKYTTAPVCADTDEKTLAIGNGEYVSLFNFFGNVSDGSIFGTWVYSQTVFDELTGGLGVSVQVEDDKLLAGSSRNFVNFYKDNGIEWEFDQTIFDPVSGNEYSKFGSVLALRRNDLIIGAPQAFKLRYNTVGQGEAYHYFYSLDFTTGQRAWKKIMNMGNFFLIDSPGGEFGRDISIKGNNLIISAPYENYLTPPSQVFENRPNCGRIYMFRKTERGLYTQGVRLAPEEERALPYSLFGRFVGLFDNYVGVGITQFTPGGPPSELNFFNIDCIFEQPPLHIPVGRQSIALVDNAGYAIDMTTLTYLQLMSAVDLYNPPIEEDVF